MLVALVGILATTVFGVLEGIPILVLDLLATLFLLAAGLVRSHLLSLDSITPHCTRQTDRLSLGHGRHAPRPQVHDDVVHDQQSAY